MSGKIVHVAEWRTPEEAATTALGWRPSPRGDGVERRDPLDRVIASAGPCISGGFAWRTYSNRRVGRSPEMWTSNNVQTGCASLAEAMEKADGRLRSRGYALSESVELEPTVTEKRDEALEAERARIARDLTPGIAERMRAAFVPLADLFAPDDVAVALLTNALVESAAARKADEMIATLREAEHPVLVDNVVRFDPRR